MIKYRRNNFNLEDIIIDYIINNKLSFSRDYTVGYSSNDDYDMYYKYYQFKDMVHEKIISLLLL